MTDDRQIKALEESIEHWKENLKLAKLGVLTFGDISGDACPLCKINNDDCFQCVLANYGCECVRDLSEDVSPWGEVANALEDYENVFMHNLDEKLEAKRKLIRAVRDMIKVLEDVLKEETK